MVTRMYSSRSLAGARGGLTCRNGRWEHIPSIHGAREHLLHDQDACEHLLQGYGTHDHLLHGLAAHEYLLRGPGRKKHFLQGHRQCEHPLLGHDVHVHSHMAVSRATVSFTATPHATTSSKCGRGAHVHLAVAHKHGAQQPIARLRRTTTSPRPWPQREPSACSWPPRPAAQRPRRKGPTSRTAATVRWRRGKVEETSLRIGDRRPDLHLCARRACGRLQHDSRIQAHSGRARSRVAVALCHRQRRGPPRRLLLPLRGALLRGRHAVSRSRRPFFQRPTHGRTSQRPLCPRPRRPHHVRLRQVWRDAVTGAVVTSHRRPERQKIE